MSEKNRIMKKIRATKTKILIFIAKRLKENQIEDRQEYPQLWYYMPFNLHIAKMLQFLCKITGGHELSKIEWGYGGLEYADRWCRWCNKVIQVPKESVYFQFKGAKEFMKQIVKEIGEGKISI